MIHCIWKLLETDDSLKEMAKTMKLMKPYIPTSCCLFTIYIQVIQIHFGSSKMDVLEFGQKSTKSLVELKLVVLAKDEHGGKEMPFRPQEWAIYSWMWREETAILPVLGYVGICFEV